jgi:hypothetical protein
MNARSATVHAKYLFAWHTYIGGAGRPWRDGMYNIIGSMDPKVGQLTTGCGTHHKDTEKIQTSTMYTITLISHKINTVLKC